MNKLMQKRKAVKVGINGTNIKLNQIKDLIKKEL